MKVTDILKEESEEEINQNRDKILGQIPAEYTSKNSLYQSWRKVVAGAHRRCWFANAKSVQERTPLKLSREFNVTYQYLWDLVKVQQWKCAITGEPLAPIGNKDDNNRISIDRIDSTKGYIPGNIQFITARSNLMKWTHDQNDFVKYCQQIVSYTNKNGIPYDPADQSTKLKEAYIKQPPSILRTWKNKSGPLHYFLTSPTNEPLYADLAAKIPWRSKTGSTFEKMFLTPQTAATLLNWVKLGDAAYREQNIPELKEINSRLLIVMGKCISSASSQLEQGKYPEELGVPKSVLASLKNFKIALQDLHDGKKMILTKKAGESQTDGRYMTQIERKQFEDYMLQIDQYLQNRPSYEQAKALYDQVRHHIDKITRRTLQNTAQGITPAQFLANQLASSKFDVVDDDRFTSSDFAALDPQLQKRITAQQQRGAMPDEWDRSKPEHRSWKKVLNNAFTRILSRSKKREETGKTALDQHKFNASNEELWKVINDQNWTCPYTGNKLEATGEGSDNQLSPDRINSSLGYVSGNIRFVTYRVNIMKGDRSSADFVNSCRQIVANQKSKKP